MNRTLKLDRPIFVEDLLWFFLSYWIIYLCAAIVFSVFFAIWKSVSWIFLGIAISIVLVSGVLTVIYICFGVIHTSGEIEQLFHCKVLSNRLCTSYNLPINRWIERKRFNIHKNETLKKQLSYLASVLSIDCQKKGQKSVYVISSALKREDSKVKMLSESIENNGVSLIFIDDFLQNEEKLKQAAETSELYVFELYDKSKFMNIAQEIELCQKLSISIKNVVLL